jgi:hypothetical protein
VRLYEFESDFESDDPIRVATTAALSRIKADIEDTGFKGTYKVKSLLSALRKSGVHMSRDSLQDVYQQEPWSNFIANIKGDEVILIGSESEDDSDVLDPDDTAGTLNKMAKRSEKNHEADL